jgi:hypothetical protein
VTDIDKPTAAKSSNSGAVLAALFFLRNGPNKARVFVLDRFSSQFKCLWVRPRAYPTVKNHSVLLRSALALLANIRLG